MSAALKRKSILLLFLILLIFAAIGVYIFEQERQHLKGQQKAYIEELQRSYEGSIDAFASSARSQFISLINDESVMGVLRQLPDASSDKINELHTKLYHNLQAKYEALSSDIGVRQFHFHLPDGRSFLRMHRPQEFNDPLFDVRYSVYLANTEKRYVQGFEEGRIFNGMRYVFPIIENGVHFGSVEISYSMSAIIDWLSRVNLGEGFYFLLQRSVVEEKVFPSERKNYRTSAISDQFVEDIEVAPLLDLKFKAVLEKLKIPESKLAQNKAFLLENQQDDGLVTLTFMPVTNVRGEAVGYLIRFDSDASFYHHLSQRLFLFFLASILGFYVFFTVLKKNEKVESENSCLNEALYEVRTLAEIVEEAPVEIYVFKQSSLNFLYANRLAISNSGYQLAQLKTMTPYEMKGTSREAFADLLAPLASHSNDFVRFEAEQIRSDKTRYPVEVKVQNIDFKGTSAYVAMVTDISEQNELLRKLTETGETMIAQSRLAAMGEMIGLLAHQWRQPIAVIEMALNNLILDLELGDYRKDELVNELKRLGNKVESLSSMIEGFRGQFMTSEKAVRVDSVEVLNDVLSMMQASLENHQISVELEIEGRQVCYLKRDLLFQVILILVNNAKEVLVRRNTVKPTITIRAYSQGKGCILEVCDNAGGISFKPVEKVFEPYSTTKKSLNTSGMGLYIAKLLVEKKMHGHLKAFNLENGACLQISLSTLEKELSESDDIGENENEKPPRNSS